MPISHITGYKFVKIDNVQTLRDHFIAHFSEQAIKGTILISLEGVNINVAGEQSVIGQFRDFIQCHPFLADMTFRETPSHAMPYKRFKVKIKDEIITFGKPDLHPEAVTRAPTLSPLALKQWLDEKRDIVLLDTRNQYEIEFGTFTKAMHLGIDDFSAFADAAKSLSKEKPVVMFCTGGIRCEKASLHLMNEGFSTVYQLEGGIIDYFIQVGGAHYEGECFVFDERVALTHDLKTSAHTTLCCRCHDTASIENRNASAEEISVLSTTCDC